MSEIRFRSDIGVRLVQHVGSDATVVAAARVSTEGAESVRHLENEAKTGLIRYLMRQHHGTPFEHNSMTFLAEAPIFVFREWMRHRIGWSYSESSARYRELEPVFWVPQDGRPVVPVEGYKAARPEFGQAEPDVIVLATNRLMDLYRQSYLAYLRLLELNVAKEVARSVLPVATYSSMYATCNARSLMAFLSLRTHEPKANHPSYPQAEIEEAARKMESEFARLFPVTYSAFNEFGREAP